MTQPLQDESATSIYWRIAAVNGIANNAYTIASTTATSLTEAEHKILTLQTQVMLLQAQVNNLTEYMLLLQRKEMI